MEAAKPVRICVPVCENRAIELRRAIARAGETADIIELRLDYLQGDELFKALPNLPSLISGSPRPVIVTLRPVEQGGQRPMDDVTRTIFWVEHFLYDKPHVNLVDMELDLALSFQRRERDEGSRLLNWDSVICSHHDFNGVPVELDQIFERMRRTPARILKIAVTANDITDCIPVFRLLARARLEGREMIAIAMGDEGVTTRIMGPAFGSFLTYGSTDLIHATAPGQISARDLRDLYRIAELNPNTEIVGLAGSPVAHSLSPHIQNAAFKAIELNAVYLPFEVRDAARFLQRMVHPRTRELNWNLRGLSVTAPHKMAVMEHLDWVEPCAQQIGSVNTIVAKGEELHGYNTDAAALITPLRSRGITLSGARCAVIGAGGAARSVLWALQRERARVTLFARRLEVARPVAAGFGAEVEPLHDGASFGNFDLVMNATPLGTLGELENETVAITHQLRGASLAYDLVYNPEQTRFLREARAAGCDTLGGLEMLVAQAAEQFRLWTGKEPPLEVMNEAALRKLRMP